MDDNISENGSNLEDKSASFAKSGELSSSPDSQPEVVYAGPVYHIGINRLGHHFCHPRFLRIRGTYIEMFKKEPSSNSKPIRQGISGKFLKVEDAGRRKINDKELYVLRISDPLDGTTKGEIGCRTASDLHKWKSAFLHAKEEAGAQVRKSRRNKSSEDTDEFKLTGHRPRVRRYARDLIMIGKGSYSLLWKDSKNSEDMGLEIYGRKQDDDTLEHHEWRCVRLVNGIRLLEDTSANLTDKTVILKAVGVVEASPSLIFETLMTLEVSQRKEWDILTDSLNRIHEEGNYEIVHGTFDPTHTKGWKSKRDFVFSRTWRHDPDNTYTIFQESVKKDKVHKENRFKRITWNPTFWEIKPFMSGKSHYSKSLVSQTMEIRSSGWGWKPWKKRFYDDLENSLHYMMLCQVAGLRDYFAANPAPEVVDFEKHSGVLNSIMEPLQSADSTLEEFFDAEEPEEEEVEEETDEQSKLEKPNSQRFKARVLALMGLTPHGRAEKTELVSDVPLVDIKLMDFKGSLPMAGGGKNSSCWRDPGGGEFMVRGKTYLRDYLKIPGGDPLLKLLAVDWLCCEKRIDSVATSKNNVVQSEAGKRLPFILVINLQVPATPNYSLVFYFGAERPIREGSLLDKFVNADDAFRDSRFKLIPRIVEGYWFVKRAVGTKACLLGKAVTCNYIRQDNFLEIDVDIGSSSVARSIINLVLGHVTSLVVDMAILIEGKDESELPEYLLGTTRVIRVEPDRAVPYNY